ncbi:MAG: UPF0104 family protein, partial [Chloroflexi bacterium]|nr:UPF0104 family protein [Chloroflexota bacterium]
MKDIRNKLILGLIIAAAVWVALLVYADLRELQGYVLDFPPLFLIPIVGFTLFNYLLRWIKWHYFLKLVGVEKISIIDSASIFVSGFVLALSPGKVAELLKAVLVKVKTGTPVARTAPVILAERVTDGLAMLVLAAIGFGGILLTSSGSDSLLLDYVPAYFAVLGILVAGVIAIQIRPLMLWILGLIENLPILG